MPALFLKTHVSGYSRKDGTYVAPHEDRRVPAKSRESKTAGKTGKEKRDATATKEFREWFGDSKVVDADGKPLVVYHGTTSPKDFGKFRTPAYFTSSPDGARLFGEDAALQGVADENEDLVIGSRIMPVYLSIKNPMVVSGFGEFAEWTARDRTKAEKNGYDGLQVVMPDGEQLWMAFRPEQIKSAIGNRGTFDRGSSDITKSSGTATLLFLKTHVKGYTRKNGVYVPPHERRSGRGQKPKLNASMNSRQRIELLERQTAIPVGSKRLEGLTEKALRSEAEAIYREEMAKGPIKTLDGRSVNLTMVGFKETKQHSADRKVLDILPQLRKLLSTAIPLWSEPHERSHPGDSIRAWHNYGAKVATGGREYYARLVVRESVNGEIYYDNDLTAVEGAGGRDVDATQNKSGAAPVSADRMTLADWVGSVKNEQVAKSMSNIAIFCKAAPTAAKASEAQLEAGNYRKKHIRFQGLEIAIENPAGSTRSGTDRTGKKWKITMVCDYGYIKGSMGVDGDHVDCYVGPDEEADTAYVVHQRKVGRWDEFDEDKVMLGFPSEKAAKEAYLKHYDDPRFLGPITAMPMEEFKKKALATKDKPKMIKAIPQSRLIAIARKPVSAAAVEPGKPVLCLDFDGVLHDHDGLEWTGEADIFGPPIHGAKEAVDFLRTRYSVAVHSARCGTPEGRQSIVNWLAMYGITVDEVCEHKPAAFAYVDDLGVPFYGDWSEVIARVRDMPYSGPVALKKALPDDGPMVGDKIEFASDRLTEKGPSSGSITDTKITEDVAYILVRHSDTEEWMSWSDLEPHARRMKNVRGWLIKAGECVALFTKAYVRPHSRRVNGKVVQVGGYENKVVAKPKDVKLATDGQNRDLFEQAPAPEKEKKLDPALDPERIARMAEGVHRAEAREMKRRAEWEKGHADRMAEIEKVPLPTWQSVDGVDVLRIGDFPHVAVPANGKKNSATFHIIDLRDRSDIVTQLKKVEVNHWLMNAARNQS
jgi:hypothetical protein